MACFPRTDCSACGAEGAYERFSLGAYYARLCDPCWDRAAVRKESPEGFDPLDAGEALEPDDGAEAW